MFSRQVGRYRICTRFWQPGTKCSLDTRNKDFTRSKDSWSCTRRTRWVEPAIRFVPYYIVYNCNTNCTVCLNVFRTAAVCHACHGYGFQKRIGRGRGKSFLDADGIGIHRWARLHWRGPTVSADMTVRQTNERIRLRRTYTHYYCDVLCTFIILPSSELHLGNTLLVVNKSSTHVSRDSAPTVNYCSHIVDTLHYNII